MYFKQLNESQFENSILEALNLAREQDRLRAQVKALHENWRKDTSRPNSIIPRFSFSQYLIAASFTGVAFIATWYMLNTYNDSRVNTELAMEYGKVADYPSTNILDGVKGSSEISLDWKTAFEQKKYEKAERLLKMQDLDNEPFLLLYLGLAQNQLGKIEESNQTMEKALNKTESEPRKNIIKYYIAINYLLQNKTQKAIEMLDSMDFSIGTQPCVLKAVKLKQKLNNK